MTTRYAAAAAPLVMVTRIRSFASDARAQEPRQCDDALARLLRCVRRARNAPKPPSRSRWRESGRGMLARLREDATAGQTGSSLSLAGLLGSRLDIVQFANLFGIGLYKLSKPFISFHA